MKTSVKSFVIGFVTTASVMMSFDAAFAQEPDARDQDSFSGTIITGVASIPEFEGASNQSIIPLVAGELRWEDRYFAVDGVSARANVLNSRNFEFGPVADISFGRGKDVKSGAVRALGLIDDAYQVGAFAAVKLPTLLTEGDEVRLSIQGTRDVSDVHEGWLGEVSLRYRLPVSSKLSLSADASVRFADDKYAKTYFSVSTPDAAASGLDTFEAEGGVKDLGASLTATYALTDRWAISAFGGYRRLVGDFGNSPIVKDAGDRNQLTAGIGIGFNF